MNPACKIIRAGQRVRAPTMREFLGRRLRELCWTVLRTLGLAPDSPADSRGRRVLDRCLKALYRLPATVARRRRLRFIDPPQWIIEAVGHLATDFDSYLKDNLLAGRSIVPVVLCDRYSPANEVLVAHWARYFTIIRSPFVACFLRPLLRFPDLVDDLQIYCSAMRTASRTFDVQARWAGREPLLHLTDTEIAEGEAQLRGMGVPEGAWFVCVHAREGGYAERHEWVHSYRNVDIADYAEAMEEIVARGGWCIRMGDATMRPLPATPNVVDYAISAQKSAAMDVFLCARCRFFLGNSSGLFNIAGVFGRPSALANAAPLGCAYGFFPNDLAIPKRLADADGQAMSFVTAFADPASEYRLSPEFTARGISQINNTPAEIRDLAAEMLDRLDGTFTPLVEDENLQAQYRALLGTHHYARDASSRIGAAFLRAHHDALVAEAPNATRRTA